MASRGEGWDPQKMLDLYLHDYLVKKNMHKTAEIFQKEADVSDVPVALDPPDGFLHEWWSMFYDVYAPRQPKPQQSQQHSSNKGKQKVENNAVIPHPAIIQQTPGKFTIKTNYNNMLGQPIPFLVPPKPYNEEQFKHPARIIQPKLHFPEVNRLSLLKLGAPTLSNLQQAGNQAQGSGIRGSRHGINLDRTAPIDSTLVGVRRTANPFTALRIAGPNEGFNSRLMNRSPIEMMRAAQHRELLARVLSRTPKVPRPNPLAGTIAFGSPNLPLYKTLFGEMNSEMIIPTKQPMVNLHQIVHLPQQQPGENDKKRKRSPPPENGDRTLDRSNAEDAKLADENVESYLSNDDENADNKVTPFCVSTQNPSASYQNGHKGFSFEEVSSLLSSEKKILCCHFSSDGKLLASGGHQKKISIWNLETFDFTNSSEGHSLLITDVRFRPSSTVFATSSFDKTVQIWDAAWPNKSLFKLLGHVDQVMSLDFHPRKVDLLCSCDNNDEIRWWNINPCNCSRISKQMKGASKQVRFQPRFGNLLATASGNTVNVIDVETDTLQFSLKGHDKEVFSVCWDATGQYIASVSEDSAQVWSALSGGDCIHKLHSNGNKFQSCIFHPSYSQLLILGGYQSLELWNPTESSTTLTIQAHQGLIASLAGSSETKLVASASHDRWVKLWK